MRLQKILKHHGSAGPCWHLHNLSIIVIVRFEDEFSLGVKSVKDAIAKKVNHCGAARHSHNLSSVIVRCEI